MKMRLVQALGMLLVLVVVVVFVQAAALDFGCHGMCRGCHCYGNAEAREFTECCGICYLYGEELLCCYPPQQGVGCSLN